MAEYHAKDTHGYPIKLTSNQKNMLYRKSKELKIKLKDRLCTNRECEKPTERNVNKMLNSEFTIKKDIGAYTKMMGNIGADPKDCSTEKLRRR